MDGPRGLDVIRGGRDVDAFDVESHDLVSSEIRIVEGEQLAPANIYPSYMPHTCSTCNIMQHTCNILATYL